MSSLFGRYSKERAGREILESEDYFVTYSFYPTHLFIEDMYIVPEKRGSGLFEQLVDALEAQAKSMGITKTTCTVCPVSKNADEVIKKIMSLNFKIYRSTEDLIYLSREVL